MKRLRSVGLGLLVLVLLATAPGWCKRGDQSDAIGGPAEASSQDGRDGFGRPETTTGTILMIKAEEGIVVVAVHGTSQAPSTVVVVHSKSVQHGDAVVREEDVTTVPGPGETDFSFRITRSTLIKVDGRRLAWTELQTLKGQEATVRFVPRRAGNFALGIEVG
jgi:hypothetical protein